MATEEDLKKAEARGRRPPRTRSRVRGAPRRRRRRGRDPRRRREDELDARTPARPTTTRARPTHRRCSSATTRYVYAAFMAGAMLGRVPRRRRPATLAWYRLGQWKPELGEPTTTSSSTLVARRRRRRRRALLLAQARRRGSTRTRSPRSSPRSPGRRRKEVTNSTIGRHRRRALFATVFFALHGPVLGVRHRQDLQLLIARVREQQRVSTGVSRGVRHGQEVVRHPDLLGLREQGERGPAQQRIKAARHGGRSSARS